jgi:hypothetical protein
LNEVIPRVVSNPDAASASALFASDVANFDGVSQVRAGALEHRVGQEWTMRRKQNVGVALPPACGADVAFYPSCHRERAEGVIIATGSAGNGGERRLHDFTS